MSRRLSGGLPGCQEACLEGCPAVRRPAWRAARLSGGLPGGLPGCQEACREGCQAVRRPVRRVARLSRGLSGGLPGCQQAPHRQQAGRPRGVHGCGKHCTRRPPFCATCHRGPPVPRAGTTSALLHSSRLASLHASILMTSRRLRRRPPRGSRLPRPCGLLLASSSPLWAGGGSPAPGEAACVARGGLAAPI